MVYSLESNVLKCALSGTDPGYSLTGTQKSVFVLLLGVFSEILPAKKRIYTIKSVLQAPVVL